MGEVRAKRVTTTEAEIKRMIRAATAAGLAVVGIRNDGGKVEIVTGEKASEPTPVSEFDMWKARRDARSAARGQ